MQRLLKNILHASICYPKLWPYVLCMQLKTCHLIICKCVCVRVCVRACVHARMCVYVSVYVCTCVCMGAHIACVSVYIQICILHLLQGESLCSDKIEQVTTSCP